jgi:hypothetical protein
MLSIIFRFPDVSLSVASAEEVFRRTQFKTHDNVKTAFKLEIKERSLTYGNKRQEKSSCGMNFSCTHKDYAEKSLLHKTACFHVSDSFIHFKLNC